VDRWTAQTHPPARELVPRNDDAASKVERAVPGEPRFGETQPPRKAAPRKLPHPLPSQSREP